MAAALVLAQLRAQMALPGHASAPTLGFLYLTSAYAEHAQDLLDHLSAALPEITDWSGAVSGSILATNVEYVDEPALAVMLCQLPHDHYRVFSGVTPLALARQQGFEPHTALVHADADAPDLPDLIAEMALRTASGYLFGGLTSSRAHASQLAHSGHGTVRGQGAASGLLAGGLSGVAFARDPSGRVLLMSRLTQGCQPVGPTRTITACEGQVVTELDGQAALPVMLADLHQRMGAPQDVLSWVGHTLVGLSDAPAPHARPLLRSGQLGGDVVVRDIIGLDTARGGIAIAQAPQVGMQLSFCQRDAAAARRDLVRICAEIREELEPQAMLHGVAHTREEGAAVASADLLAPRRMLGAIYVSCASRGGSHFGGRGAELHTLREALGDVPLVGFFAQGEIARHQLYGYAGVLTVFTGAS